MRISDWSSDVCSSDLQQETQFLDQGVANCRREASCCTIWFLGFGCVARRYPGRGTEEEGRIIDPTDRFKSKSTPSSSWRAYLFTVRHFFFSLNLNELNIFSLFFFLVLFNIFL